MARSLTAGGRGNALSSGRGGALNSGRGGARREQDRPSRLRLWLRRRRGLAKPAVLGLLTLGAVGALGFVLYLADPAGRVQAVVDAIAEIGESAGFEVTAIDIQARVQRDGTMEDRPLVNTPLELVRAALGIEPGDPIISFSPGEAKQRLETIAWVESAHVERRLPGTILVRITERTPFAIWQHNGRFSIIDRDGKVVTSETLDAFGPLPLVVGAGANTEAFALWELLQAHGEIARRTQALVRVGERRWNLRLHNGADVLLPEGQEAPALNRLAEMHQRHALLDRPLVAIDMRLPDRMVLRPQPAPEPSPQQRRAGANRG